MDQETVKFNIKERVKIEKFEGALIPGSGQQPVEVLEIEDGTIISHYKATAEEP